MRDNEVGSNPVKKWVGFFMKRGIKKQFDQGLKGIKEISESQ
jgi:hypothetical protein